MVTRKRIMATKATFWALVLSLVFPILEVPVFAVPAIDLNPPVKALPDVAPGKRAVYRQDRNYDILENGWFRLRLAYATGLSLTDFTHKPMTRNALVRGQSSLFLLEVDGRRYSSQDFEVTSREGFPARGGHKVVYHLKHEPTALRAELSFSFDQGPELEIQLALNNFGGDIRKVTAAFPMLTGIGWSDDFSDDWYLYPYMNGVILNLPIKFASAYGGWYVYLQQMVSYSPSAGGGLYMRVNDKTGELKILHFTKSDERQPQPALIFETVVDEINAGIVKMDARFHDPFPSGPGTHMAFSYQARELKPNEQWVLPTAVLGVMNGDWHVAMESYRNWYESWSHKRPYPTKLTGAFSMEGISAAHTYHTDEGYSTDMTKPGHIALGHLKPPYWKAPIDLVEHTSYWEWDEVTDQYMDGMSEAAKQYGKKFDLWPDRHGNTQGKHWYWGQQGDYGLRGYNERWGGLPAFRQYLDEMKRKGYVATLYINRGEAALSSIVGKEHGLEWCTVKADGSYLWAGDWMGLMCMNNPLWRRYLADTCHRLISETGADGIRVDVFGAADSTCYSTKHFHTFGTPGQSVDMQAQVEACREIRLAMDKVDPTAVLMSENPGVDAMWQYLDGTLSYDSSESARRLVADAYAGKGGEDWEGFVGLNVNRFYFPRFKVFDYQGLFAGPAGGGLHPAWRLFNGTGAFNREWTYTQQELQILQENSDAFGTLSPVPMIPTLMPLVYVNRFPADNKTVYTIYNARKDSINGEIFAIDSIRGYHFVDLYNHHDVKTVEKGNKIIVGLTLDSRSVGCLVYLPDVMDISVEDKKVKITTNTLIEDASVKIVDLKGQIITEYEMQGTECNLPLPDTDRAMCKLYSGKRLVDALPLKKTIKVTGG